MSVYVCVCVCVSMSLFIDVQTLMFPFPFLSFIYNSVFGFLIRLAHIFSPAENVFQYLLHFHRLNHHSLHIHPFLKIFRYQFSDINIVLFPCLYHQIPCPRLKTNRWLKWLIEFRAHSWQTLINDLFAMIFILNVCLEISWLNTNLIWPQIF